MVDKTTKETVRVLIRHGGNTAFGIQGPGGEHLACGAVYELPAAFAQELIGDGRAQLADPV